MDIIDRLLWRLWSVRVLIISVYTVYMTLVAKKITRKNGNGKVYYTLVDERRVNGKIVQKYVGYLGKDPKSKMEISYGQIMPYMTRLMDLEISDSEIHEILKKIGIDIDISPITRIVIENDRKLKKTFLRIR